MRNQYKYLLKMYKKMQWINKRSFISLFFPCSRERLCRKLSGRNRRLPLWCTWAVWCGKSELVTRTERSCGAPKRTEHNEVITGTQDFSWMYMFSLGNVNNYWAEKGIYCSWFSEVRLLLLSVNQARKSCNLNNSPYVEKVLQWQFKWLMALRFTSQGLNNSEL